MPYVRIWIHLVWSIKNRQPLISKSVKAKLIKHIKENAKSKNIYIDTINGDIDHLHILLSLGSSQPIAKIAQLVKGESSNWINKEKLINSKFEWQDDYFAVSIGESTISSLRKYIKNQEIHHKKKTFSEEYQEFIDKYRF